MFGVRSRPNGEPSMPQNRKPPPARVNNRAQRALAVVESMPVAVPEPGEWDGPTLEAWQTFWTSELAGSVTEADHHAVRRLFNMRDAQGRAFQRYADMPYIDGSRGQPRQNPAFDEAMALERAIVGLEDRLGLTPKARANLGIAFGQQALTAAELNRRVNRDQDEPIEVEGWEEDSGA